MNAYFFAPEVATAKATLATLSAQAKIAPLSPVQVQTARRASIVVEAYRRYNEAIIAENNKHREIERLMKRGYTSQEAYQKIQAEQISEMESRGFGERHRCRFY